MDQFKSTLPRAPRLFMVALALWLSTLIAAVSISSAQEPVFRREIDTIPVISNGIPAFRPFAGGLNSSIPIFPDIDNDGDFDLLVGEQDGNISFYRNDGDPANPAFTFVTDSLVSIPGLLVAPGFADIDNDGDIDLLVGEENGNINFYRNDGAATAPAFTLITETFGSINVGRYCFPTLVDIDNDGDVDLFVGEGNGNINFYRNDGTAANPAFTLVTDNLVSINVIGLSAPSFADIDNDGDRDLFVGGVAGNVHFYLNTGTAANPAFTLVDQTFASVGVGEFGVAAPTFTDIDKDGDVDLFAGEADGNINFYRNDGSATNAAFTYVTANFAFNFFDVGVISFPSFPDIDNDGDFDLFVGEAVGNINFYRNDGTATKPAFTLVTETFASIDVGLTNLPTFADIDNDGDLDLFVGENEGNINFYRNDGSATNPDFTLVTETFASIDVGFISLPTFADIDADGDLDLFVGAAFGNLFFYRNDGTAANPAFTPVPGNFVIVNGALITPTFADIDNDGDLDLLVGEEDGNINFYRNTGTAANHAFTLVTENFASIDIGLVSRPSVVDIDKDGDLDLFVGDGDGGINFYRNVANRPPVVANPIPNQTLTLGRPPFTRELNTVFTDAEGDALTYTATSSAANIATASIAGSTLTVAPLTGGSATITVTAADGKGGTVSTTFSVAVNRPPVLMNAISNQTLTLGGSAFTRDLNAPPAVFSDPDGEALAYTVRSSDSTKARASLAGSTLTITPLAPGSATITVTANDGRGGTAQTTFIVSVNRLPILANAISNQTVTVGGASFTRDLNASPAVFTDPDGDILAYMASSSATTIATASISGSTLTVAAVAGGSATITVTANDGKGETVSTTFTVTVNRPPVVASPIGNQIITLGPAATFMRDLRTVFTDPDGEALNFTASSSAPNIATATISVNTLTVAAVAAGNATTIAITANDGRGGVASTQFIVKVNRAPVVANPIPNQRLTFGAVSFMRDLNAAPMVFRDLDNDTLRYTAASSALNIATATISGTTLTVASVGLGNATIKVRADDRQGGMDSTTFMVTVVRNEPPIILTTPPLPQPSGQPITIQATITDETPNPTATLRYRRGGDIAFSSTPMSATGSAYQGIIPGSIVTSRGVEAVIVAKDSDNDTTRRPAQGVFSIAVLTTSETKPSPQPAGSAETAYRLVSVPIHLDNPGAANVLEDDLGPYNPEVWRLFGLAANQPLSNKSPYAEFPNAGTFVSGKSLFLIVRDAGKVIDAGPGQSVKTDQEFRIPLQVGHNFVAAPFNFNIPVSKLRLKSGGTVVLRTYNGSGYPPVTEMQPWEGYYLPNNSTTVDTLFVNSNLSSSSVVSKKDESLWRLQILASCDQARDTENFAGVAATSEDGWDDNDLVEPPPIGEYVSVYFPHEEWLKPLTRYSDDMRAASNPNQKWSFVVENNISNQLVALRFDRLQEIDPALAVFLVDEALNYKQNLRENPAYQYQPRSRENTKTFTLIVGRQEFVDNQTTSAQGVPENFVLEQNFPNPFNGLTSSPRSPETAIRFGLPQSSVVTIKIFDLAGHEVATLLERAELPAGRHQRVWDGRDAQGRAVTSGIYFYRLSAGSFAKTMKLMLMR